MRPFDDIFADLGAAFETHEVKVRSQGGKQLHYITARTAMNRLDEVLGPANWWDEYDPRENSVLCKLTIRLPDGSTLTKADAGGYAGMADSGDDDKSGYSDAFKRAAVKFGVGRYLYNDGIPPFARAILTGEVPDDRADPREPTRVAGKGDAYEPPAEAAPSQARAPSAPERAPERPPARREQPARGQAPRDDRPRDNAPRTGKALFAWTKDQEQRYEVGLLKYINNWAKLQEYPGRMVDWDGDQVSQAYAEACRKLASLEPSHAG